MKRKPCCATEWSRTTNHSILSTAALPNWRTVACETELAHASGPTRVNLRTRTAPSLGLWPQPFAHGEIRTHNTWLLRPVPLPVGARGLGYSVVRMRGVSDRHYEGTGEGVKGENQFRGEAEAVQAESAALVKRDRHTSSSAAQPAASVASQVSAASTQL